MDTTGLILLGLIVLFFALLAWLIQSSNAAQRHRRIKALVRRDRAKRLNRSLAHEIDEPTYIGSARSPCCRSQRSTNENSPEFHRVLQDLRFTHFWRSEAWRWEEAHRILRARRDK